MWKPGQLITICEEVYRVKRCKGSFESFVKICNCCAFNAGLNCDLILYSPKYRNCLSLIPDDCYFERVSP